MSTPEPQAQPLTRKQLRELQQAADATPSEEVRTVESPSDVPVPGSAADAFAAAIRAASVASAAENAVTPAAAEPVAPTTTPSVAAAASPQPPAAQLSRRQVRALQKANKASAEDPSVADEVSISGIMPPVAPATPESGDTTGSQHLAPTALIFNRAPDPLTLTSSVTSTGEVLVTGVFALPTSVGSRGHAPGTTDGKDVDASIVDPELAASSSPAPVAASSAIGTIKPAGEVIRQPAPEKGSRLLMSLTITAGALAIALTVALILAFTNGVF